MIFNKRLPRVGKGTTSTHRVSTLAFDDENDEADSVSLNPIDGNVSDEPSDDLADENPIETTVSYTYLKVVFSFFWPNRIFDSNE